MIKFPFIINERCFYLTHFDENEFIFVECDNKAIVSIKLLSTIRYATFSQYHLNCILSKVINELNENKTHNKFQYDDFYLVEYTT